MKEKLYAEGDIYIINISETVKVIGVIARERQGAVLGYFFKNRDFAQVSDLGGLLLPVDACFVRRFGDLSMIQKQWPIVGKVYPWIREEWSPPVFCDAVDGDASLKKLTIIDDDDPSIITDIRYTSDDIAGWGAGFSGSGALLVHLARIFGEA